MAMPFLNFTENSLNLQKFKKKPKNSNLNSFWAFLLSIFIYISIFYVFHLSPSTLLYTTKFWFIISNTLILIIAADFEAFSSSEDPAFLDDHGKNNVRAKGTNLPSFQVQYVIIDEKTMPEHHEEIVGDEPQEKIVGVVVSDHIKIEAPLENKPHIFITDKKYDRKPDKPSKRFKKKNHDVENGVRKLLKKRSAKIFLGTEPEIDDGKMDLKRTLSERYEEPKLEENEFSRMSDEELNRRVEEFIRRCNRQIRLQANSNRQQG